MLIKFLIFHYLYVLIIVLNTFVMFFILSINYSYTPALCSNTYLNLYNYHHLYNVFYCWLFFNKHMYLTNYKLNVLIIIFHKRTSQDITGDKFKNLGIIFVCFWIIFWNFKSKNYFLLLNSIHDHIILSIITFYDKLDNLNKQYRCW